MKLEIDMHLPTTTNGEDIPYIRVSSFRNILSVHVSLKFLIVLIV